MKELYQQYYQLCVLQQACIQQADDDGLAETIEKKERLIQKINQLNQPITHDLRPLLEKIATLEEKNKQKANQLLNERRKQAVEIDRHRQQINQYIT